jgi:hypothetical protein
MNIGTLRLLVANAIAVFRAMIERREIISVQPGRDSPAES